MRIIARKRNNGFTLVEVLVALLILTLSMLAIFEGLVLLSHINLQNLLRDEAVRIAEEKINSLRNSNFSETEGTQLLSRRVKNFTKDFMVSWRLEPISTAASALKVDVKWVLTGKEYTHSVISIVSMAR